MLLVLLAALGLLAVSAAPTKASPLSKLWAKTYLVPAENPHIFQVVETPPGPNATKALTMITKAIAQHGAPVWTTPDGKLVAFRPLSEAKAMADAGFVLFATGKFAIGPR